MGNSNQEQIVNNLSLVGKLFDLKYFYILLVFILSIDIYITLEFHQSIFTIDFLSIINQANIKYLIQYLIGFGFMVALVIPFIKFGIYKIIFKIIGKRTLKEMDHKKEISSDYIRVDLLYREALLENNQFKLDKVNEYYKYEKEVDKTTNIVMAVVIFFCIDLLISSNDIKSLLGLILDQILSLDNKFILLLTILPLCLFIYVSIVLLITGYDKMWNNLTIFPKNEKASG